MNGAFTAKVTDPALNELTLADSTNWFDVGSSVRVAYLRIDDPAVRDLKHFYLSFLFEVLMYTTYDNSGHGVMELLNNLRLIIVWC